MIVAFKPLADNRNSRLINYRKRLIATDKMTQPYRVNANKELGEKMAAPPTIYDEQEHTWSRVSRSSMYNQNTSVGRTMFNTMKNWPKNVCQINDIDGVSLTSGEAITLAVRIAQHFQRRGLSHTDVIGICARNTTYLMPLGVACLLNATPFHAVNPALEEATIKHIFGITRPLLIFCDGQEYEKVKSATMGWKPEIFTLSHHLEGVPKIESLLDATTTESSYQPEPLKTGGSQTVAILCSSGTTGLPKAVCISNNTIIQENLLVNSECIIFTPSSLDWITGFWGFIASTVFGCTRIITSKPYAPATFVSLVKKYKIDYAILGPWYLNDLVACPEATTEALESLRMLNYGGGLMSLTTLQRIQTICTSAKLNSGYGMTEVGMITVNLSITNTVSAGTLLPGIKIRIVDEDGNRQSYNQIGEIYVHTGKTWNGYYGNPEETRLLQDSEGWFHTGDLGYFDAQNVLYIVDRKKEIVKYKGNQYWPTEIESVIAELPQVKDVCVISIFEESVGDAAGALVVRRQECEISAQEIIDHVAKRLTSTERQLHSGVQFVDNLPHNANGKILRKLARDQFVDRSKNP